MNANEQQLIANLKHFVEEMTTRLERAGRIGNDTAQDEATPLDRRARKRMMKSLRAVPAELKDEEIDRQLTELEAMERRERMTADFTRLLKAMTEIALVPHEAAALEDYHAAKRLNPEPGSELDEHVRAMNRALRAAERKGKTSRRR